MTVDPNEVRQGPRYGEGPDGMYVMVQQSGWSTYRGKSPRWGYVLHRPGWWPHVSEYRWGSAATAQKAGLRDLAEYRALLEREPDLNRPVQP